MIIHHHTKFGQRWLWGSGDIERTRSDIRRELQMDRQTDGQSTKRERFIDTDNLRGVNWRPQTAQPSLGLHAHTSWQRWRSRAPSFCLLIWPTLGCKIYLIMPQWFRLRTGSQILDCNNRFCDDYACIWFLRRRVVFHRNSHGTA